MESPYEKCPVYENNNYLLRLAESTDAPDLLLVYSDEKAVPLFNSDNCHGDTFYYASLERMKEAIAFWEFSYRQKYFVRWSVVDKHTGKAVGTVELFRRSADDYFDNCGILRLDLRSDWEDAEKIYELLSLIVPPAFALFECRMVATKVPPFASERKKAAERMGFLATEEPLIGGEDRKIYKDYYVLQMG